ncbi:3-keto-disaccharide hydrolase [Gaoshiqia sediminis]|uniref:DUF1080 domain-containing protein n=1 Tax=Gaoshiqia sediminis TaxID=2986998 RepID=A0AA41Y8H6_9BACT|nr:DUF1080 domain-containing protein [Gaoshiqia sediminis]MCW0483939.1 DUF1080 domain-containing protein [Gaoshiqia sediminis]
MKSKNFIYPIVLILAALGNWQCHFDKNDQKTEPDKSDWVWLFHGTSTDAWQDTQSGMFPAEGWKVSDNELTVLAETDSTPAGHDIISREKYSNFELELEIKLTEGANSGIKYFVSDQYPDSKGKYLGLEYQLIDDERHDDAKLGQEGNRTMASLYDLIPASKSKEVNSPGTWNKVRIVVDGAKVEHWLNGQKVLEFDRFSDSYRQLVALSKYKNYKNFGELNEGHILLQGHKDEVSFRSIRIRTR